MNAPRWNYAAVVQAATSILASCRLSPAPADGEDYAQEACVVALRRGTPEPEWTTAQLVVLARYAILDTRRRSRGRQHDPIPEEGPPPSSLVCDEDQAAQIDARDELAAVLTLAERDRRVRAAVLYAEGETTEGVAATLGVSYENARTLVKRGRDHLRVLRAAGKLAAAA